MNYCGKYESYWGKIYGPSNYVEYKGYVYCAGVTSMFIGKNMEDREYAICRTSIANGEVEVIDRIFMAEFDEISFERCALGMTIFNDTLYYFIYCSDMEQDGEHVAIVSIDLNTKTKKKRKLRLKNPDNRILGILAVHNDIVCIYTKYNSDLETQTVCITDLSGKRKVDLGFSVEIEGYNEQYVYYKVTEKWSNDAQLCVVNLNTFDVTNLSSRLYDRLHNGEFYHVDPRKDIVYVKEENKLLGVNMDNKIVEELVLPELPNSIVLSSGEYWELRLSDDMESGRLFFNGENWIININPMDVDKGEKFGVVILNADGRIVGDWLHIKERDYISINQLMFMLPNVLCPRYEIYGLETGRVIDSERSEQEDWRARMLSVTKCDGMTTVKDMGVDLHYLNT